LASIHRRHPFAHGGVVRIFSDDTAANEQEASMDVGRCWAIGVVTLMMVLGCSAKGDLIVLLPDDDGTVGHVEVANKAGSQALTQAKQSVSVRGAETPPEPPVVMSSEEIETLFGPAMAALPPPSLHFLLYFGSGAANLSPESSALIGDILEAIRLRPSPDVIIIGHTDRTGSDAYNRELSLERANGVRAILIESGVEPGAIRIDYHGEGAPLIATGDDVPEPRNRRVEVVVR
jgi:outer membrane protein OmpA-like peptidoglycan-associated protein